MSHHALRFTLFLNGASHLKTAELANLMYRDAKYDVLGMDYRYLEAFEQILLRLCLSGFLHLFLRFFAFRTWFFTSNFTMNFVAENAEFLVNMYP